MSLTLNLVAGTAWLFAGMDQNLDFLFVDEAGQVSLANLVAMGTSSQKHCSSWRSNAAWAADSGSSSWQIR